MENLKWAFLKKVWTDQKTIQFNMWFIFKDSLLIIHLQLWVAVVKDCKVNGKKSWTAIKICHEVFMNCDSLMRTKSSYNMYDSTYPGHCKWLTINYSSIMVKITDLIRFQLVWIEKWGGLLRKGGLAAPFYKTHQKKRFIQIFK